ncbi:OB-fold domain-containing protein [Sphingomonadaceae bacterium OTU29THOMA1]|nr:OB-fold domain-containing protein [Sphingomonadaceae bacterium OTU29THOMA1]
MAEDYTPASPVRDPDNAPFFDALRDGKLLIKTCNACNEAFFYPRALCPFCLSESTWVEASGDGEIYSYTQVATRAGSYVLALVTLAEGPTLMTNVITGAPEALAVGQRVRANFIPTTGDEKLPVFVPG